MSLLTSLLILIVLARLLGRLFARYQQPAIVGEICAGIILGPSLLNLVHASAALSGISQLAVFLVVLSAGLEMRFHDVIEVMKGRGLVLALISFFIPLFAGIGLGLAFELDTPRSVFLGLCISITALPVTVKILESFDVLHTDVAKYSVATAVINDIAALLALGVILDLPQQRSFLVIAQSVGIATAKLILLAFVILGCNWFFESIKKQGVSLARVPQKLLEIFGADALFGIVVLFVLIFGSVSESLGFHFIIGAFFGALLVNKDFFVNNQYADLGRTISSITKGFLGPVFFAYIGLEFGIQGTQSPLFFVAVIVVSILTKVISGWAGARLIGMPPNQSWAMGIILNGRGVMELVIASIAFQRGFIEQDLFSILVLMGIITTMITPVLFRKYVNIKDLK